MASTPSESHVPTVLPMGPSTMSVTGTVMSMVMSGTKMVRMNTGMCPCRKRYTTLMNSTPRMMGNTVEL